MVLEWKTCPIGVIDVIQETVAENPFDLDVQLPDYVPDIHRILSCTVSPQLNAVSVSADRLQAEGFGLLRMLYCTENGALAVVEQSLPIRCTNPAPPDVPQMMVRACASTEYVNTRASGQRKATVHGVIAVRFSVSQRRQMLIPTESSSDDVQLRTYSIQAVSSTAAAERVFAMSEVVECGADVPPIAGIVSSRTDVHLDSTRAVQDKILLKGEVVTEVRYLSQQGADTVETFRHTMPLSQVIEAQGVTEPDVQDVSLCVLSAETTPKPDGSGDNRLLEISLHIAASVRCSAPESLCCIADAFSTSSDLQPTFSDMTLATTAERWSDSFSVREKTDLAGTDLQSVLTADAVITQKTVELQDDTALLSCAATVRMLGRDGEGMPVCLEKPVSFVCRKLLSDPTESCVCTPDLYVTQCRVTILPDGTAEVLLEGRVEGMLYGTQCVRLLTAAEALPLPEGDAPSAMTIYFADAGESVWDIARRYRTTEDAIRAENAIETETLPEKRMLIIPATA